MNRFLTTIITLIIFSLTAVAEIKVTIADGIENESVKANIEHNTEKILNEVNAAQAAGRDLNFKAMGVNSRVSQSMAMLWENTPFMCTDDEIVENCLTTKDGYQIRNIPLMMKPTADRNFNEEEYQEAVISFDKAGNVESFYLSISMNLYMKVIKSNLEVTDLRRRQLILDYVEQFRTAYNQKDIKFLDQVFSDDALIITGRVIMQKVGDGFSTQKIRYYKQGKQEYLRKLNGVFHTAKYIKVTFDDIQVTRHPVNPNFYGVLLHQGYTTNRYHDVGYVFLLWDFTNENAPKIHVRTWQPDKLNGKDLPKEDLFKLSDFDI